MMFPIYVNGCCLFASQLYVDVEQRKQDILLGLRAGREVIRSFEAAIAWVGAGQVIKSCQPTVDWVHWNMLHF